MSRALPPEPRLFELAELAHQKLDQAAQELELCERQLAEAARVRDLTLDQVQQGERRVSDLRDEIASDTLATFESGKSNKEQRDAAVAASLREHQRYCYESSQVAELKTKLRNDVTNYDLALSRVKSAHRAVDARVSQSRLLGNQLHTLSCLVQYDTAKLGVSK